jgi:hypothetical protein
LWRLSKSVPYLLSMKLDLLTDATVVDDAIRFVNDKINANFQGRQKENDIENDVLANKVF